MQDRHASPARLTSKVLSVAELRRIVYEGFCLVREVGDSDSVADFLADPLLIEYGSMCEAAASRMAEAHGWLLKARAHEALHGRGAMADRSHPFMAKLENARQIGLGKLRYHQEMAG